MLELLKLDLPIAVLVHPHHDLLPLLVVDLPIPLPQYLLYLIYCYRPVLVLVKQIKHLLQFVILNHLLHVQIDYHKFRILNRPILVQI